MQSYFDSGNDCAARQNLIGTIGSEQVADKAMLVVLLSVAGGGNDFDIERGEFALFCVVDMLVDFGEVDFLSYVFAIAVLAEEVPVVGILGDVFAATALEVFSDFGFDRFDHARVFDFFVNQLKCFFHDSP